MNTFLDYFSYCSKIGVLEFYSNDEIFHDFLDKFDSVLPILLKMTHLPNSGAALVSAVKSFYLDNDLTANASVVSDDASSH